MRGGILRGPASVVSLEVRRLASLPAPLAGDCGPAKKLALHTPSSCISAKNFARHARKHQFWAIFRTQGELFRAHTHHQTEPGELFRAQDPAHGDFETNDTSAATDAGQRETTITNARP